MYRDLNLDHLIFQNEKVVLVDHGSTVLRTEQDSAWYFHDQRGTWETMAPEEFRGYGELTERTATYRVAVISHLVLTGSLPFPRLPLRRDTHKWRRSHSPAISRELSDKTRHIFASALNRRSECRFKSPDAFFQALQASLKQ